MKNKMYLIIGVPGSGKSTKAAEIQDSYNKKIKILEADMFFYKNGIYKFDPSKLHAAHQWCQDECRLTMSLNIDVIISNTSLTPRERRVYIEMAKEFNYDIKVITMNGNFQNIHGVPDDKVELMKKRYIPFSHEELG